MSCFRGSIHCENCNCKKFSNFFGLHTYFGKKAKFVLKQISVHTYSKKFDGTLIQGDRGGSCWGISFDVHCQHDKHQYWKENQSDHLAAADVRKIAFIYTF